MMPQMQAALWNWQEKITLIRISQAVDDDGNVIQTEFPIVFIGAIQPLKPTKLEVSSSGQRAWEWWQIHTAFELHKVLEPNDLIKYQNDKVYKLILQNDYSRNGFLEYHLIENYQNA